MIVRLYRCFYKGKYWYFDKRNNVMYSTEFKNHNTNYNSIVVEINKLTLKDYKAQRVKEPDKVEMIDEFIDIKYPNRNTDLYFNENEKMNELNKILLQKYMEENWNEMSEEIKKGINLKNDILQIIGKLNSIVNLIESRIKEVDTSIYNTQSPEVILEELEEINNKVENLYNMKLIDFISKDNIKEKVNEIFESIMWE